MRNRITRNYFIPNLDKWLKEMKNKCAACKMTTRNIPPPATAAMLPPQKCLVWQIDYIGKFPPDSSTGHR